MENKIAYLEKQLKIAISNNEYNEANRFYNNLIELGMPKEKYEYVTQLFNKNENTRMHMLEKLEAELRETTDLCENKRRLIKKYSIIDIIIGAVLFVIGVVMADNSSDDCFLAIGMSIFLLGGVLFILGLLLLYYAIPSPAPNKQYNKWYDKQCKEIYEKYLDKNCFDTFMHVKYKYPGSIISGNMYLIGVMPKGAFYKGDTLYLGGELYEVLDVDSDFDKLNEKLGDTYEKLENLSDSERKLLTSEEMIVCIHKGNIEIPQNAIYAIKV